MKNPIDEYDVKNSIDRLETKQKERKIWKTKVREMLDSDIDKQTKSVCPQLLGNGQKTEPKNPWAQRRN